MTKKQIHKTLYKLWQEKSLEMWRNQDIIEGGSASTFHHYVPKSRSLALKYDPMNAVPLNAKNHYLIHFSPEPEVIRNLCDIIRKKRGKMWCDYIEKKRKEKAKNSVWWLEEQLEKLGGNNG